MTFDELLTKVRKMAGKLKVDGDAGKALEFANLLK